ncbi:MAG: hypothetical protein ACRDBQ_18915 [Shewanella sp.]
MAKKRNKKYSPKLAQLKVTGQVVTNALNRIAFITASNRKLQPYGGRAFQYTTDRRSRVLSSSSLADELFELPHHYHVWMCHFIQGEGDTIETDVSVLSAEDCTLTDFTENLLAYVETTKDPEVAPEKYIAFAMFIAPNDHYNYDSDQTTDLLIENFIASGVLEKETHLPSKAFMMSRQELAVLMMSDLRKFDCRVKRRDDAPDIYVKEEECQS